MIRPQDITFDYGSHAWSSWSYHTYTTKPTGERNVFLPVSVEIRCQILPTANYTTAFLIIKSCQFWQWQQRNLFITAGQESTFPISWQFSNYCFVLVNMNQVKKWKEKLDAIMTLTSYLLKTRHSYWRAFLCINWAFPDKTIFSRSASQLSSI